MSERKNDLMEQMKNSKSKSSNFSGKRVLNFGDEVQFLKPKTGINKIDILPYTVATDNHPHGREKGSLSYVLDVWVHGYIGINKSSFVCPNRTYGKRCPICEKVESLKEQGNEKLANKLKASRRVFYNVMDRTSDNNTEQLYIFSTSFFLFEKELTDEAFANSDGEDSGIVLFADIEEGKTVRFRANEVNRNGIEYQEFKSFAFIDREREYDERILKHTYQLDSHLVMSTYEEMKNELLGMESSEEIEEGSLEEIGNKIVNKIVNKSESIKLSGNTIKQCPFDHVFADEWDEHKECDECDLWKECKKENKNSFQED